MRKRLNKMATSIAAGPFAEPVMGLTALMVGLALAMPGATFAFSAYDTLAAIAPERVWAALFIVIGASQIVAALLEAATARILTAMASGALWTVWTIATMHSGFRGVLWAIGASMVVGQGIAYLRTKAATRRA